jgi:putative drug exporter of the RND superfamily
MPGCAAANQPKLSNTVIIAVVAAAVILFLAYGSLLAMLLPLITAVFGLGCGLMAVGLLSHATSVASLAPSLAVLVGLGVGIDYALVIVTRYRGRLLQGDAPENAAARALSTAGRAVLIAAGTVCIALLGMLVLGMPYLNGVAIAAAVVVLLLVASAETLQPAPFGILRLRVLYRRQRRKLDRQGAGPAEEAGQFWLRWADFNQGRPAVLGLLSVAPVQQSAPQRARSAETNPPSNHRACAGRAPRGRHDPACDRQGPLRGTCGSAP